MEMTEAEALEKSIEKYKRIIDNTGTDLGDKNCALCEKYYYGNGKSYCVGCPVLKKTKRTGCANSPWEEWYDHLAIDHQYPAHVVPRVRISYCRTCLRLCREELAFLESLREPKNEIANKL